MTALVLSCQTFFGRGGKAERVNFQTQKEDQYNQFEGMPSEALQRPARQPVRVAISTTPPRLRPKGPLGRDFPRQLQAAAGGPKQSAVERLEADKAKYVKSQVALCKQLPVRVPDGRKPPPPPPQFNPNAALRPTRKSPAPLRARREPVELNLLNNLTNLISGVNDGPQQPSAATESQEEAPRAGSAPAGEQQQQQQQQQLGEKEKPRPPPPPPRPNWSSMAKVRLKASRPAREDSPPASPVSPAARTVRRVDVMPPSGTPRRAPVAIRQPLHPVWLQQPHFPLRQAASRFHLQHPSKTAGAPPLKAVAASRKPTVSAGAETPTSPAGPPAPAPAPLPLFPPPSPARTRLSSSSSRKRPSLTRSKSDMSDRCSRVGTELERFFNLCGLDPADLQEWAGSCSDIVSMARFRSVSAPGSECAASDREGEGEWEGEEEAEDVGNPTGRVPYGLSVIERNARVIKWLYGLRNAKDSANKSTDL